MKILKNTKDEMPKLRSRIKDFNELVGLAAQDIHSGLLEGGGKEMKSRVFKWLSHVLQVAQEERSASRKKISAVHLATRIRDEIMKNEDGDKAERIKLCDKKESDLGGYGRIPLREIIQAEIEDSGVCE